MATTTRKVTLRVDKENDLEILAKQGDASSRFLQVTFADANGKIDIENSATVTINARRADGEAKSFTGTVNADGTVTVPLTAWLLGLSSFVFCDVAVYQGDAKLSSANFRVNVQTVLVSSDDVSEDENYDTLTVLIKEVQEALDAEEGRVTAEEARVSAETDRQQAEEARTEAESARETAEEARVAAEEARAEAEAKREDAETGYVAAAKSSAEAAAASETAAAASEANAADSATLSESWAVGGTGTRDGEDTDNSSYYAQQAAASKEAAASSASAAASSETNASASEQAAAASESAAASSEAAAAASEQAAAASQAAAAASETNAAASESNAASSETAAKASETAAASSAAAAANSETNAKTSETNAAASETIAKQYSGKPPKALNGTWWTWDADAQEYIDTGKPSVLTISKSYATVEAMQADFDNMETNDLVIIAAADIAEEDNAKLYIRTDTEWQYLSDLSGASGVGISGIERTDGDGSAGTTDTYTITLTNGSTYTFTVTNGTDTDAELQAHLEDTDNPHGVTAEQAGAVAKTGDTMTGDLVVNGENPGVHLKDTSERMSFKVNSSNGRTGLYDIILNKWMIYSDGSNEYTNTKLLVSTSGSLIAYGLIFYFFKYGNVCFVSCNCGTSESLMNGTTLGTVASDFFPLTATFLAVSTESALGHFYLTYSGSLIYRGSTISVNTLISCSTVYITAS